MAVHSHTAAALAGGTLMASNPDAIAAAPAAMQTNALQHQGTQQQQQQPLLLAFPYMGHAGDAPGALGYPQHTAATPGGPQQQPAVLGLVPGSTAPPVGRQSDSWTRLLEAARSAPPPADISRGTGCPAVSMGRADGAASCRLLPPRLLPGALPSHGHTLQPGAMMQRALGSSADALAGVFDDSAAAAAAAGVATHQASHTLLPAVAGSFAGAEGLKRALPGTFITCPMDVSNYEQPLSDPLVSPPSGSGGLQTAAGLFHQPAPGGQAVPGSNPAQASICQPDSRPGKRAKPSAAGSSPGQQQRVGARASADTQTQDQGSAPAAPAALTGTLDPRLLPARHEPLQPLLQALYPGHLQQLGQTQLSAMQAAEQQQPYPLMHQGGAQLATAHLTRGQLATATLNGGQLAVAALQVLSLEQLLHQPRERVQQHARLQLQRMLQPPAAGPVPGSPEAAAVQQLKQHISHLQQLTATAAGTGAATAAAAGARFDPAAVPARQEAAAEGVDFCDELLLLWSISDDLGLLDVQQADVLDRILAELLLQDAEQPLLPHQCDLLQQAAAAFMKPYEQHPQQQLVLQLLAEHLLLLWQLALQQRQQQQQQQRRQQQQQLLHQQQQLEYGQLQPEVLSGQQQRLRQQSTILQAQVGLAQQQQQQQQQPFTGAHGRLAAHQWASDSTQASHQHAALLQGGTGGVEGIHSQQMQPQLHTEAHPHYSVGNPTAVAAAAAAAPTSRQQQQQQQQEEEDDGHEGEEELLLPSGPQAQLQDATAAANGSYTGVYPKAGGNWKTQISLGKVSTGTLLRVSDGISLLACAAFCFRRRT